MGCRSCAFQTSPERYLELASDCLKKVQSMTLLQFNHGLCQHLAIKLLLAVQIAQGHKSRSDSPQSIERVRPGSFKLLFRLAKEVESFIHACCNAQWIQHAVIFTNVSEYVSSLGYELDLCREILLKNDVGLALRAKVAEASIISLRAIGDQYELLEKANALKESSNPSTPECQLATCLHGRLTAALEKVKALIIKSSNPSTTECQLVSYLTGRLTSAPTLSIPGSVVSSSSSFWEVDYGSLEQLEKLGAGGAGVVHKTRWLGALVVAEKTFFGSDHPSFWNEISILAGLSHPNIAPLFGYAMDNRRCSIVMELMEGDLFHLMQTRLRRDTTLACPFTISEAVDIMLQVAEGVCYLHQNKVVHRDLKSHNILIKSAKEVGIQDYIYVKVADFGLSKTKETSTTFSNQSMNTGTTRWMAPELMHLGATHIRTTASTFDEVKKYPFKSDVYSFGMVCFEILTGEVPFQSTCSQSEVRRMVRDGQRPRLLNQCPPVLESLIQSCWESDASARPNFGAICTDLRNLKCLLMLDTILV